MKEILVRALKAFKYSPNGKTILVSYEGEEIYLGEKVAKGLMDLKPPYVELVDEDFKPVVFSSESEFVEKTLEKEVEIADVPVEILLKDENTLESLSEIVAEAKAGFDELTLGLVYKAVQKNGQWYNIFKVGGDAKLNKKGIARDKIAEYVYNLYLEEV